MRKLFAILIILLIVISGTWFYFQEGGEISEEISTEQFKNLGSIILENTKFKEFKSGNFYFRYPDWQKIEIDPKLLWPEEISQKQEILLYLTNPDGVKIVVTKREVEPEFLDKPYPLIFREIFNEDQQVLEKEGNVTDFQVIREIFFEDGILLESKMNFLGMSITSLQMSIIIPDNDFQSIYSVGISAREKTFEDYRALAEYTISSIRHY
jgi:hypothetical protein